MELVNKKSSLFSFAVAFLGRTIICHSEVETEVSHAFSISEIKSFKNNKIEDELPKGERIRRCNEVLEVVRHDVPQIKSVENNGVEGQKKYLVQLLRLSRGIRYSIKVLPAFKCPTSPPIYIHVKSYDKNTGNMKFLVITKIAPVLDLKYISSYGIRLVKNITEAFLEEIPRETEPNSPGISVVDADELPVEQRLQMCERAATTISEMNVKFVKNATVDTNKYYALKEERGTDYQLLTSSIVHAFRCPTDPEIYVHIEKEENDEKTLWTIATESEQYPIFDILGFLLQPILDATEVSSEELKTYGDCDEFCVHLDKLGEAARYHVCRKSILVTLGAKRKLLENRRVEESKLYSIKIENRRGMIDELTARAIKCPTVSSVDVYVGLNVHPDVGNMSSVFLKKNEPHEELSPWV